MPTYDITPTSAARVHASELATSIARGERLSSTVTRLPRLAVSAVILGVALSLIAAGAQAETTPAPAVNVNTADTEALAYLPGIGPATADNLLYAREQGFRFASCEDLETVSGIGPKTRDKICPHVIFEGETTATAKIGAKSSKPTTKYKRPTKENTHDEN